MHSDTAVPRLSLHSDAPVDFRTLFEINAALFKCSRIGWTYGVKYLGEGH